MGITFDEPLGIEQKHFKNVVHFLRYLEDNNVIVTLHEMDDEDLSEEIIAEAEAVENAYQNGDEFVSI